MTPVLNLLHPYAREKRLMWDDRKKVNSLSQNMWDLRL